MSFFLKLLSLIKYVKEKGFFHLLSVNFLTQFLGFGSMLLVAKFLKASELADIKVIQSYTSIFTIIGGYGLSTAVFKFCSENRSTIEKKKILSIALTKSLYTIIISFCSMLLLNSFYLLTPSNKISLWMTIYSFIIPIMVFNEILVIYLQALKMVAQVSKIQAFIKIQSFVFIVLTSWKFGFRGFIFSTIFANLIGLIHLVRYIRPHLCFGKITISDWSKISLYSFFTNLINTFGGFADLFILDRFVSDRTLLGYYSLATIFILGAMQITSTVQSITVPYFSANALNKSWLKSYLKTNQLRLVVLSIFVAICVYLVASILIPVFYDIGYTKTLLFLGILLIKYILWSSYALMNVVMFSLKQVNKNLIVAALSAITNIVSSIILLNYISIIGVALGQVIAAFVALSTQWFFISRYFKEKEYV